MALGISPMNMISYHWHILQKGKKNFYNPSQIPMYEKKNETYKNKKRI